VKGLKSANFCHRTEVCGIALESSDPASIFHMTIKFLEESITGQFHSNAQTFLLKFAYIFSIDNQPFLGSENFQHFALMTSAACYF
jgi:hypothetical protein